MSLTKTCLSVRCIVPKMFKTVAERGRWTSIFTEADKLYESGDIDNALILYFLAAELGVEVAESNVAFILEQGEHFYLPNVVAHIASIFR